MPLLCRYIAATCSGTADRTLLTIDPNIERQQIDRVRVIRASRSAEEWRTALDAVTEAARDGRNLVPPIVAAVEAKATLDGLR